MTISADSLALERPAFQRWLGRLAIGLGVLSVLAIAFLVSTVSMTNRASNAALEEQRRAFGVMLLGRQLESTLTSAEATLGRYVISGDKQVGRAYYEDWRHASAIIRRLEQQTSRNPTQRALIRDIRAIYDRRGAELAETAIRTNYGQNWNALGMFYQAGTAESLEQMSDLLQRLIDGERANLRVRTAEAGALVQRSNRTTMWISLFGVALVLGAGVLAWLTARAVGERRLADQTSEAAEVRADELEMAVAARTAELSEANGRLRAEAADRAAAEAQLRQVQKLEAVGKLTGGIAHDFNNMLAVVTGGLELAHRRVNHAPDEARRQIDNAMEGAQRAAALTRRLLAFSRAEPLLPAAHDPAELIAGIGDLIDRTLGERIRVSTRVEPGVWPIWVDRHGLENALLNLSVNARDAIAGDGNLGIVAGNRTLATGEIGDALAGDYVAIEVADDGCGMTPEVLERVFEPFFTTKPVGEGTGLGLSQVFGFIGQSAGEIVIRSAPGQGTSVMLLLPRHAGDVVATKRIEPAGAEPAHAGHGRAILVVEDDPRVMAATVGALAELGHRPVPCNRPEAAAAMLADHGNIDMILSDVVMPGMTGPELVAAVRVSHPQLAVLFVTGFTGDAEEADFGGHPVLRKPFTIAALARAISEALPADVPAVAA